MFSHTERERVAEIRQGDQRNRAKGRIKTLREKKNGGEIGTRKATQLHPQRSLSLSLSLSHQFTVVWATETMFRILIFPVLILFVQVRRCSNGTRLWRK